MKAIIHTGYGAPDLLKLREIATPSPKAGEIQIKVHATAVSSGDARMRRADPWIMKLIFGWKHLRSQVQGFVFSGVVSAVGEGVTKFAVGDEIYGTTGMRFGAHAEYLVLPADGVIAPKPTGISHEEAAAVPFGGNTALYFLRQAGIASGQRVLIYGGSGAIGTAAVQIAKYFGAHVTTVSSGRNANLMRSLGADEVIDYTVEDFANRGVRYDVILDTVGKADFGKAIASLTPNGRFALAAAGLGGTIKAVLNKRAIAGVMKETADDLAFFNDLIEAGKFKAVIDRSYPLEDIAEAHAHVDTGHKVGNVVIRVT